MSGRSQLLAQSSQTEHNSRHRLRLCVNMLHLVYLHLGAHVHLATIAPLCIQESKCTDVDYVHLGVCVQ